MLELAAHLHEELEGLGVRLVSRPGSAITTFTLGNPDRDQALLARLLDAGVYVSVRYTAGVGGVRVSTHYYNDEADLAALLAGVRNHARGRAKTTTSA